MTTTKQPAILHKTTTALNGQKMTCIARNNKHDITVQFEDGTIVTNIDESAFRQGYVKNPNLPDTRVLRSREKHVGETATNTVGQKMTIVRWDNTKKIIVRFDDGYETTTSYSLFTKGQVENPNYTYRNRDRIIKRNQLIGAVQTMSNGMTAEIIKYDDHKNITIRFEDGAETTCRLNAFTRGQVQHPSMANARLYKLAQTRNGQTFTNNQGLSFTVTDYQSTEKVNVRFETGYETWTKWTAILHGRVSDPNYKPLIGKEFDSCYGLKTKIIEYTNAHHIKLQFEDGAIVETSLFTAQKGKAIHPTLLIRKRKWFSYHNMSCQFVFANDNNKYYICRCDKCGYNNILSAKMMLKPHICNKEKTI